MKIDKNSITKDASGWAVGDLIYGGDNRLYLVAGVVDSDDHSFYTVIDLESGYSSGGFETIAELQHHTGDSDDRRITGTFKYVNDND